jgi:putative transcriptional regulator
MAVTHHPAPESLMSCSAGSMPEAFAAVMASHIAMCPDCRKELSVMEQIGTVLFEAIAPTAVACEAEVTSMRDLQEHDERQPQSDGDVPAPLVRILGTSLDGVQWKRAGRGIWQHRIALSHEGSSTLRLIKVAAGLSLPEHGHSGPELTLVLRGSFRDDSGQYTT